MNGAAFCLSRRKKVGEERSDLLPTFFFRRIAPGICPTLDPAHVSRVLVDGIWRDAERDTETGYANGISGVQIVASLPFFETGIEDDNRPVGFPHVVENGDRLARVLAVFGERFGDVLNDL